MTVDDTSSSISKAANHSRPHHPRPLSSKEQPCETARKAVQPDDWQAREQTSQSFDPHTREVLPSAQVTQKLTEKHFPAVRTTDRMSIASDADSLRSMCRKMDIPSSPAPQPVTSRSLSGAPAPGIRTIESTSTTSSTH